MSQLRLTFKLKLGKLLEQIHPQLATMSPLFGSACVSGPLKQIGPFSRDKNIHAMLKQLSVIMYLKKTCIFDCKSL